MYKVDERYLSFLLMDWLRVDKTLAIGKFADVGFDGETAIAMINEAIKMAENFAGIIAAEKTEPTVKFENGKVLIPQVYHPLLKQYAEAGFQGVSVDPVYGGMGFPHFLSMIIMGIFSGACMPMMLDPELTIGAANMINKFGTKELKEKYLPNLYSLLWGGTMCLTEPDAGSDVGNVKLLATPQGDDSYKLEGTKTFISNADGDQHPNFIHTVLARTPGAPDGTRGISLFLVPKFLVKDDGNIGDFNNVTIGNIEHKIGIHGSATCTINFDGSTGWLIGELNQGFKHMLLLMNHARLFVGAEGCGQMIAALCAAIEYAKERKQFKTPLIEFPDIRRMLMIMKAMAEGSLAMVALASYYADRSLVTTGEEQKNYDVWSNVLIPICKSFITDWAVLVCSEGIQVHGGYGYSEEYTPARLWRDSRITPIYEGTNGIQATDLITRRSMLDNGNSFMTFTDTMISFCRENENHPILSSYMDKLIEPLTAIRGLTLSMAGKLLSKDMAKINPTLLYAVPFQNLFGFSVMGYCHLDMAKKAYELLLEKGKPNEWAKLAKESDEVAFLYNRILTTTFFIDYFLPQANAWAQTIKSGNTSPLDVIL